MTKKPDPLQCAVDRRLGALRVPDDLESRIRLSESARRRPLLVRLNRPIALAATLCLLFACSFGVLAAAPVPRELFAVLGAQVAAMLQPVERSCTDNGIETTVVAAMNDSETVDIYVAVRDLEGSRVDANTDLADVQLSGFLDTPFVQLVQFDEKSRTATFRVEGMGGENLSGKKITLSIGAVLLGRKDVAGESIRVSAADIAAAFPTPRFRSLEGEAHSVFATASGPDILNTSPYDGDTVLEPAAQQTELTPVLPWGTLAAGGVQDGLLHLLVRPSEVGQYASVGVSLKGDRRLRLEELPQYAVSFGAQQPGSRTELYEYTEYVLPLPEKADPKKLEIQYSGTVYTDLVTGSWSTTFRLENVSRQRVATPDLTLGGWHIKRVELSPMGVSVTADRGEGTPPEIAVYNTAGELLSFNAVSSSINQNSFVLKNQFASPLPLDLIGRVTIGGEEIQFR